MESRWRARVNQRGLRRSGVGGPREGGGEGPDRGDDAKSLNEITKLGRKEMRNGRDS